MSDSGFLTIHVKISEIQIKKVFFESKPKEWELEKETKANSDFLLIKSSGIIFNFYQHFT